MHAAFFALRAEQGEEGEGTDLTSSQQPAGPFSIGVVVLFQLLLLVRLDFLFRDAAFNASLEVGSDCLSFNLLVKDKLVLDLLRELIELELPVVAQIRRREQGVEHDSI